MGRGAVAMLMGCVLSALVGPLFALARAADPALSSLAASCVRVAAQVVFVLVVTRFVSGSGSWRGLILGDGRRLLWIWGFLGAICVASFYASMARIGFGAASVLAAASGILMTALSPFVLGRRIGLAGWLGTGAGLVGVALLNPGVSLAGGDVWGWIFGLVSAMTAALAYLAVARLGEQQHTLTVMSYWAIACVLTHGAAAIVEAPQFPASAAGWSLLAVGGFAACLSQYLMTVAFQRGDTAWLATLSYAAPVASMLLDVGFFAARPTGGEWAGAALIIVAGAAMPLMARRSG